MTFLDFCASYGVLLNTLPAPGKWVRVPTEDKPRSRNGAVKWLGYVGFVQNWATQAEPAMWRDEQCTREALKRVRQVVGQAQIEASAQARKAAQKALHILSVCELAPHPYLERKGFAEATANVWKRESDNIMVVPMRAGRDVVGCQFISPEGDKKFLFGQRSGGAEFRIGQRGLHVLCEGYATGLSAYAALRNLKIEHQVHVAFSAGNMVKLAQSLPHGLVIADNDASGTGERAAQEIGWPYWMSNTVGEDCNDAHQRIGTFALAMQIKAAIMQGKRMT